MVLHRNAAVTARQHGNVLGTSPAQPVIQLLRRELGTALPGLGAKLVEDHSEDLHAERQYLEWQTH